MSHFTVLVIGENIEKQLAPYAEQEFEDQYGVFNNMEEEYRTEFETGTIDAVEVNGHMYSKYDQQFRNYSDPLSAGYNYPATAVFKTVPHKEFYANFEEYLSNYHGVDEPDERTGLYGYWNNPNAQWDWYSVGGRWTGYFKPKVGTHGTLGRSGSFDNQPRKGWVDQIRYCDIDFESMKKDAELTAHETYDKVDAILKGREIPSWERIREKHGDDIKATREEYHSHPVIKDFNEAKFDWFGVDLEVEYGSGREAYVQRCVNRTSVPFAVLYDGKWYQKGEMGWFGMSSDKMTQEQWNEEYWKLLETLEPDTLLTLVDCHI